MLYNMKNTFNGEFDRVITDKRILKTRKKLKDAFMTLALEKEITAISVSDLTNAAGINRSTFYLHYDGVKAVISEIDKEIDNKVCMLIDRFTILDIHKSAYTLFENLTTALDGNKIKKNYILYSKNAPDVVKKIKRMLIDKSAAALTAAFPALNYEDIKYRLIFAAGGIIDAYVAWSYEENKTISLEEIVTTVGELVENIIKDITKIV